MPIPLHTIEFERSGALHDPDEQRQALQVVTDQDATDVLVLIHGWNNDMPAAKRLFEALTFAIDEQLAASDPAGDRRLVALGGLWPSVRWADDEDLAGGGAGVGDDDTLLHQAISDGVDDPAIAARLSELAANLDTSADARAEFLAILRDRIPQPSAGDEEPPPSTLMQGDPDQVFDEAAQPLAPRQPAPDATGGGTTIGGFFETRPDTTTADPEGGAAGFGIVDRIKRGARALLNLSTYYTMKQRAGDVGANGVAELVHQLDQAATDVRVHLVGHSFGARVAVAAANQRPVHSISLLQGAFSHHGLAHDYNRAGDDGFFRGVLAPDPHMVGPMIITHTRNDKAVGIAYALASRLARQQASGIGGPDDLYGGIGSNGALKTPERNNAVTTLLKPDEPYHLASGKVHNLKADDHITGHSDITNDAVAHAILSAVLTTP